MGSRMFHRGLRPGDKQARQEYIAAETNRRGLIDSTDPAQRGGKSGESRKMGQKRGFPPVHGGRMRRIWPATAPLGREIQAEATAAVLNAWVSDPARRGGKSGGRLKSS